MANKVLDKAYLLKQLKGYDTEIAAKKYVAITEGYSLISAADLAKIGTNETAIGNLQTLVGTLPSDAVATDIVNYIKEVADAAQEAATYDDTAVKADIKANADAIDVLNGAETVTGSVAKTVADAINDFATKISDDGTINTFKELIDYAASHTAEFSTLSGEVQANTNAIATLNGTGAGSVAKAIADANGEIPAEYATVKAYVDAKAKEAQDNATLTFETTDIDFATEW